MATANLAAALWYSRFGLSALPIGIDTKRPLVSWKQYQSRAATHEELTRWWERWPDANIGMACGAVWDVTVVDCDTPEAISTIERLIPDSLTLPMVYTPKGGRHFYFTHTPGLKNWTNAFNDKPKGIDIRTTGGQVLLPPSTNGNKKYRWFDGLAIHQVERPPMPESLLSAILKACKKEDPQYKVRENEPGAYGAAALARELAALARASKGQRNATLNRAAHSLGQLVAGGELDAGQVESTLLSVAVSTGLSQQETIATIRSGLSAGAMKPRKCKNEEFKIAPKFRNRCRA